MTDIARRIAFLGLGDTGQVIVPRLIAAGHTVVGWNRSAVDSRRVAQAFADAGLTMLDAPLSGSPVTVVQGKASVMVGGDEAAFERVKDVLLAIGLTATYISPSGMAVQTKRSVNLLLMVEGAMPEKPLADVTLQQKDMTLVLEQGRILGSPVPLAAAANELMNACRGHGHGHGEPRAFPIDVKDVPTVTGLRSNEGWVDMQVQFLLDKATAGTDGMLLGWTVLPPGARHDRHLHEHADEFWIVLSGHGKMNTDDGVRDSSVGDVVYTTRGEGHGFHNDSDESPSRSRADRP